MDELHGRPLIYATLLFFCGVIGALTEPAMGLWSFLQVATVIEIIYWIGLDGGEDSASGW